MSQISLTFPDGAKRAVPAGTTGLDVAKSIAPSLAKRSVAMSLDGKLADLAAPIKADAAIKFLTREDQEALELIRHDAAHVMAQAVQELYPGTQVTIGPVIENGFYYDFARDEPFTPEDLPKIEAKMREIIARDAPFSCEVVDRKAAKKLFADKGETFKLELIDAIPEGDEIKIYSQREWLDLCRGPHMTSTGKVGKGFKLLKIAGAYWRGDSTRPMLQRIYGTAWASEDDLKAYLHQLEEAEKRDHRRLGREMDLFHFQEEAPGAVFWHPKGWALFTALIAYMRRRQNAWGYVEVNSPDMMERKLWEQSGHWEKFGENMYIAETPDERIYCLQADELPGPRADLQAWAEELSRSAVAHRRVRQGASLRAVRRAARAVARAALHAGRRAYLLHRGPDHRGMRASSTSRCCRSIGISASPTCASNSPTGRRSASAPTRSGTRPRPR